MLLQGIAVARTGKVLVNTQEANDSEKELTLMLIHASADLGTKFAPKFQGHTPLKQVTVDLYLSRPLGTV